MLINNVQYSIYKLQITGSYKKEITSDRNFLDTVKYLASEITQEQILARQCLVSVNNIVIKTKIPEIGYAKRNGLRKMFSRNPFIGYADFKFCQACINHVLNC